MLASGSSMKSDLKYCLCRGFERYYTCYFPLLTRDICPARQHDSQGGHASEILARYSATWMVYQPSSPLPKHKLFFFSLFAFWLRSTVVSVLVILPSPTIHMI